MNKEELIDKYQKKVDILDICIDDLDRNISLARKEGPSKQLTIMLSTRDTFLTEWSCYNDIIKDLEQLSYLQLKAR